MIRLSKDKVLEDYFIDVNGVITDKDGVIQKTWMFNGRDYFKEAPVYRIMMFTFHGYKDMDIHHIDENKLNNKLDNLVYLTKSEHTRLHKKDNHFTLSEEAKKKMSLAHKGKQHSVETKRKIGDSHKGKKMSDEAKNKIRLSLIGNQHTKGRIWVNNKKINKLVCPDKIPEGFIKGRK